jgi:hypothetical protein
VGDRRPDERRALLGRVRRSDAARGRALLESTWAEEPPGQRAAFLACLEEGLGPGDEPFLERAFEDRRQEVRRAAVALLATLPESALVARMTDRARPALRYQPGRLLRAARLEVVRPPRTTRRWRATAWRRRRPRESASAPGGSRRSSPPFHRACGATRGA